MLFSAHIFGFSSDPFVNILKFHYSVISNKIHVMLILWHLLNLLVRPRASLIFVNDLCELTKDVYSLLGEFSIYLLVQL